MSHFYAEVQGARGLASRTGNSGMWAHVRGWDIGAYVELSYEPPRDPWDKGRDIVRVFRTNGSNGCKRELIAEFSTESES